MSNRTRLEDIIDALEMQFEESRAFLDRQTGQVVMLQSEELAEAEEEDEDQAAENLPDWQRDALELARLVAADTEGERFLPLPDRFEVDEWRMMADFAESQEDDAVGEALGQAISGRGAFRYFKDKIHELGIADSWYAFRNSRYRQVAIEWCQEHEIVFEEGPERSNG